MDTRQIQCLLSFLGHYRGQVDGLWGPKTKQAAVDFQRAAGLTPDGIPGKDTQQALLLAVGRWEPGSFWDSISYFRREEFRCRCGKCGGFPAEPQEALVRLADRVRANFGAPVTVSSGVRCPRHNQAVGGVSNSRHLSGQAMDFSVRGVSAAKVLSYVQALPGVRYAYAIDSNFVHMEIG